MIDHFAVISRGTREMMLVEIAPSGARMPGSVGVSCGFDGLKIFVRRKDLRLSLRLRLTASAGRSDLARVE